MSTNGREYTASGVRFELVSLVVSGLAPWSGPALGGTVVTIGGSRLAHAAALACAFGAAAAAVGAAAVGAAAVGTGAAWMAASAHGSEGVRCLSPGALPTGWSSVELSSHGAALRSGGSFYVHAALPVSYTHLTLPTKA